MSAPLERLAKVYHDKGFPVIGDGLKTVAQLGREMGMPEQFDDITIEVKKGKKKEDVLEERKAAIQRLREEDVNLQMQRMIDELGVSEDTFAKTVTYIREQNSLQEERKEVSTRIYNQLIELEISKRTAGPIARAARGKIYHHYGINLDYLAIDEASDLSGISDADLLEGVKQFGEKSLREVRSHFPYRPPSTVIFPEPTT